MTLEQALIKVDSICFADDYGYSAKSADVKALVKCVYTDFTETLVILLQTHADMPESLNLDILKIITSNLDLPDLLTALETYNTKKG